MASAPSYYSVLTAAVADVAAHGYDSESRIEFWEAELRAAAERTLGPTAEAERRVREAMAAVFHRMVDTGDVLKFHPGVSRYTLDRVKPQLRDELRRRIDANAALIKLNREEAVAKTLRRFRAWGTSQPAGGSPTDKPEVKADIRKSLASLPFEERRLHVDQSAKLVAAISATVALGGGAIGARWAHVHQAGYDARPEHLARDDRFFLVRDSWAQNKGLVKPGAAGYTDDVDQPAFRPFCRCHWSWVYSLRDVPDDCMTILGRETLRAAREAARNAV